MKILVPVKTLYDPDNIDSVEVIDHKLSFSGLEQQPNPFDEYAVEAALRILEQSAGKGDLRGEVTVVGIGDVQTEKVLRQCLALGATDAIRVDANEFALDVHDTARILSSIASQEACDLVIMGKQGADTDTNQVSQCMAALLQWPHVGAANRLCVDAAMQRFEAGYDINEGAVSVQFGAPAVLTVDLGIVMPEGVSNEVVTDMIYHEGTRYTPFKAVMKAKKKKVRVVPTELGGSPNRTAVLYKKNASGKNANMLDDVDALVAFIAHIHKEVQS